MTNFELSNQRADLFAIKSLGCALSLKTLYRSSYCDTLSVFVVKEEVKQVNELQQAVWQEKGFLWGRLPEHKCKLIIIPFQSELNKVLWCACCPKCRVAILKESLEGLSLCSR